MTALDTGDPYADSPGAEPTGARPPFAPPTHWLITGAAGMLGRDLTTVLAARPDARVRALTRRDLDITDPTAVADAVTGHDVVINTAAWTGVDAAETAEDEATLVNGTAVGALARACAATGARLIHISTDYVFPGDADIPYSEQQTPQPINAYGRSKLAGEHAVARHLPDHGYVLRTAWLYGEHGTNFVATMLRMAARQDVVTVVADQHGQPTWSWQLARRAVELADAALDGAATPGVYHATAAGRTTWFGLARAVFAGAGLDPARVQPISGADLPGRAARRPRFSVLSHDRWADVGLAPMPAWQTSLAQALARPAFAALVEEATKS